MHRYTPSGIRYTNSLSDAGYGGTIFIGKDCCMAKNFPPFSSLLRDLMKKHGRNVNETARQMGLDHASFSRILRGTRTPASAEQVEKLSGVLHLKEDERRNLMLAYCVSVLGDAVYAGFREIRRFEMAIKSEEERTEASPAKEEVLRLIREALRTSDRAKVCLAGADPDLIQVLREAEDLRILAILDDGMRLDQDGELPNLILMERLLPLVCEKGDNVQVFGVYGERAALDALSPSLTQCLITKDQVILFDRDCTEGIVCQSPSQISVFARNFELRLRDGERFLQSAGAKGRNRDTGLYSLEERSCTLHADGRDVTLTEPGLVQLFRDYDAFLQGGERWSSSQAEALLE